MSKKTGKKAAPKISRKVAKVRRACSKCRKPGFNSRTCPAHKKH